MTLRHKCKDRGCYLLTQMPDWAFLAGAFPRGIEPTDLDGFVEVNGHFLTLEWKGIDAELTDGQKFAFRRRTATTKDTVFVIYGDAQRTKCTELREIFNGKIHPRRRASNAEVHARCLAWAKWVEGQPGMAANSTPG